MCFVCYGMLDFNKICESKSCRTNCSVFELYLNNLKNICEEHDLKYLIFGSRLHKRFYHEVKSFFLSSVLFNSLECNEIIQWMRSIKSNYEPINFGNARVKDRQVFIFLLCLHQLL
jgi:hypothetical protein